MASLSSTIPLVSVAGAPPVTLNNMSSDAAIPPIAGGVSLTLKSALNVMVGIVTWSEAP